MHLSRKIVLGCSLPAAMLVGATHGCYASTRGAIACQLDADCAEAELCNEVHVCVERYDPSPFDCVGDCGGGGKFGDVLATYRGVPAYSNGDTFGCHPCADGQGLGLGLTCGSRCGVGTNSVETNNGLAFQCVEYIRRFYAVVYGDEAVGFSAGNANAYVGAKAAGLGLDEYVDGEATELPRPDDILVFLGGSFGHIAIVTAVDPAAREVRIIQQNTAGVAEMTLTYTLVGDRVDFNKPGSPLGGYTVHSWLRNPDHDFQHCNPNIPCPDGYTCQDDQCAEISCPEPQPSTGTLDAPADQATVSLQFAASGHVSDANGIRKITVTVDTLEQCKFSLPIQGDANDYQFEIPVDLASCGVSTGPHALGLWIEDGCGIASMLDSATVHLEEADACTPGTTCCDADGQPIPSGGHGSGCTAECRQCNGSGACVPASAMTSCAGGSGTCDGQGGCAVDTCGDGQGTVDPGEDCDGQNLNGATCESQGFDDGSLECNSNCTFDTSGCTYVSCGDGSIDPGEDCDGQDLGGATCDSQGFAGGELGCANCSFDLDGCWQASIETNPTISTWTPDFPPQANCECTVDKIDCRTLYVGRAVGVAGNSASMEFQKTDGSNPSVDVKYWVVVGDSQIDCNDIIKYQERKSGTWSSSDQTLSVSGIDVWPSTTAFADAPCDESKYLFVITGGGGGFENVRTWLQQKPVRFTKVCG